jgi:hypothetical protein
MKVVMNKVHEKSKQLLKAFVPAYVMQSQIHKRVFMQFAEKVGFVYFGYVDQRSDDHRLIRGLTVSATHRDNHYCIGSYEGYDITLVERIDTITFPRKPTKQHKWIIMTFDLHTSVDIPHIFLGFHTHSETFYAQLLTKFSHLAKVHLGSITLYDKAFTDRYVMYTQPAQVVAAEQLFDAQMARTIADHFGSFTLEITEGTLYLYAEHQRPSTALLEKMLQYGLWLAKTIDYKMNPVKEQAE